MSTPNSAVRPHDRALDALRPIAIEPGVMKYAEGSALITMGDTKVLCAASVEDRIPPWLRDSGKGWVTAEYAMLPRATSSRSQREVSRGRPSGRTSEIQRLIGRSLRAAVDLTALGERVLTLDCDVLQADGGTRTASVTGAYVALVQALAGLLLTGDLERWPLIRQVAAVSVGVVGGVPMLDLEYVEDLDASVDMNVVGTAGGELVEVQGTGEEATFSRPTCDRLLDLAQAGIAELVEVQQKALAPTLAEVEAVNHRRQRPQAKPKDESELWGPP